ncbi:hypothetical protein F7734_37535 [Scytonema sp. UIC 10036]|uniref:hypothetical protein n=1 Tax=Scytonema sp. UIC 10036 TaxID=2304196 RepID=UPI0012DA6DCC|nr:hypothetical protein [Scytonema sp. UIC 10036]MUG97709.1 hypothetical protein [Scytonema sp. UIC 10036]
MLSTQAYVNEEYVNWNNPKYVLLEADGNGVLKSRVFRGLWLATTALLVGNMSVVLAVLQQGLNAREHADFVQQLLPKI